MSKRTDYLKEILTKIRTAHQRGVNLGRARTEAITEIARRESILESTVTNTYRRGIGFDGTLPFFRAVDTWIKSESNVLQTTILGALKKDSDIQEMRTFFASFSEPVVRARPAAKPVRGDSKRTKTIETLVETLKDLDYRMSRKTGGVLEAKSTHRWDPINNVSISVKDKRKVSINVTEKIYVNIKEDGETRTVFHGEIRTPEELRLVDRLTKI
jgi:hypothetical protein